MEEFQFFDPRQEFATFERHLPHWAQAGTMCFITWRTRDSLPEAAHERISAQFADALRSMGLEPTGDWKQELAKLPASERSRAHWSRFASWDRELDKGAGALPLARPELSQVVADSLLKFDRDRYFISDLVVMPNHVHVLAAFRQENSLLAQCTAWKRFTGRQINSILGRTGSFWQTDQFDHLVRGEEHFVRIQQYIADNPGRANLSPSQFRYYSKPLSDVSVS